jgi:periplasmic copper chaperone A
MMARMGLNWRRPFRPNAAMNKLSAILGILILAAVSVTPASAKPDTPLILSGAWIRATPPNASVAGAYLRIENTGKQADRLLSAETDIAERVEIHEMKMAGDVMQMRQLRDGLPIPAGAVVALEPGGTHLMLIDPKRPLAEGQAIDITLRFAKAGEKTVVFTVRRQAPDDHAHRH